MAKSTPLPRGKPSRPPLSVEHSRKLIENVSKMPPGPQGHPTVLADFAQAKRVVAEDTVRGLERKAQESDGRLDAGDTQALADARAEMGDAGSDASNSTGGRLPHGNSARTNGVNGPAGISSGKAPHARSGNGQPSQTQMGPSIPQATTPTPALGKPSRPPLSVEHSKKLIENVAKMPERARQHPTVQADLAQAQRVVAEDKARSIGFEAPPPSASSNGSQGSGSTQTSSPATAPVQPVLPAATGRIGDIEMQLQGWAAQWDKLRQEFETARSDRKAAEATGSNAEFLKAQKAYINAKNALNQMIEDSRRIVEIPQHEQGKVNFGSVDSRLRSAVEAGARLAALYTHAGLLPRVDVAHRVSNRPSYIGGVIHMDESATESQIMHEVTHGTEVQTPGVLAAAVAFLQHRAGTGQPQLLSKLTGDSKYEPDEYAYEDQFAARGGDHYMGKDYGGQGTELLTRGIERLHNDPVEFMQNDPEYFRFIIQTLQQP